MNFKKNIRELEETHGSTQRTMKRRQGGTKNYIIDQVEDNIPISENKENHTAREKKAEEQIDPLVRLPVFYS